MKTLIQIKNLSLIAERTYAEICIGDTLVATFVNRRSGGDPYVTYIDRTALETEIERARIKSAMIAQEEYSDLAEVELSTSDVLDYLVDNSYQK